MTIPCKRYPKQSKSSKKKTLVELPRVRLNGPELDVFVIIFGYIMDSQRNELSFALIAHLVEHFIGIAEVNKIQILTFLSACICRVVMIEPSIQQVIFFV